MEQPFFKCQTMDNNRLLLHGELVGDAIPLGEVPMVDVKWARDKVGEFKVPAVFGAVWRNGNGERRVFIVNISGEEREFKFKVEPDGETFTIAVPPRSVAWKTTD